MTQWFMIAIALVVVTFTGVDTIEIVKTLATWTPAELSQAADAAVEAAKKRAGNQPTAAPATSKPAVVPANPKPSASPAAAVAGNTPPSPVPAVSPSPSDREATAADITRFLHPASGVNNWTMDSSAPGPPIKRAWGMAISFLALLLGGPFWFDLLMSLANVRSAGRKPDRNDQPPK